MTACRSSPEAEVRAAAQRPLSAERSRRNLARMLSACLLLVLGLSGCSDATWSTILSGEVTAGPHLVDERLLVATSSAGVVRHLRALEPASGQETYRVEVGGWSDCPLLLGEAGALVLGCGELLQAYEPATGLRIWQETLPGRLAPPWTLADGLLAFLVETDKEGREVLVVDIRTGALRLRSSLQPSAELLRLKEQLLVWEAGILRSLSLQDGRELWRSPLEASLLKLVKGPRELYAVTEEDLTALEPDTGRVRWRHPTTGLVAPVATEGLVAFAQAGKIIGLDASDGRQRWEHGLAGVIQAPMLRPDTMLVHTAGGSLLLLSPADGVPVWQLGIGPPGKIFQASEDYYLWIANGVLTVVELLTRQVRLTLPLRTGETPREGAVVLEGTRLFLAESGGRLSLRLLGR